MPEFMLNQSKFVAGYTWNVIACKDPLNRPRDEKNQFLATRRPLRSHKNCNTQTIDGTAARITASLCWNRNGYAWIRIRHHAKAGRYVFVLGGLRIELISNKNVFRRANGRARGSGNKIRGHLIENQTGNHGLKKNVISSGQWNQFNPRVINHLGGINVGFFIFNRF